MPEELFDLYKEYRKETINELWGSEDELREIAKNEDIIQKYVEGEYGSNLIFKYKALAFIKYMGEIHEVALKTAKDMIRERQIDQEDITLKFLKELMKYSLFEKINLLETNYIYEDIFTFDLVAAHLQDFKVKPDDLALKNPVKLIFCHDGRQKEVINGHRQEFGMSVVGIGRILSRIHVKKMYRHVSEGESDRIKYRCHAQGAQNLAANLDQTEPSAKDRGGKI